MLRPEHLQLTQTINNLLASSICREGLRDEKGLHFGNALDQFDNALVADIVASDVDWDQEGHVVGDKVAR